MEGNRNQGRRAPAANQRARAAAARAAQNARRRPARKQKMRLNLPLILIGIAVLAVLILVIHLVRGCGAAHKSAEKVAEAFVQAEFEGSIKDMKDCYGIDGEISGDLQKDMNASIDYIGAHGAKGISVSRSGILFERGEFSYVYVAYNLNLDSGQAYPGIETFMVEDREGKYYVLTTAKITDELRAEATEAYKKFMASDVYKDYIKEYETFIKKNPGYEEKIATKLA